jgi:hypothetical protein
VPNFYRRCWSCNTPEPTATFRSEQHAVLCIECHTDARRGVTTAVWPVPTPAPLSAPLVMFSEACLRALATVCKE